MCREVQIKGSADVDIMQVYIGVNVLSINCIKHNKIIYTHYILICYTKATVSSVKKVVIISRPVRLVTT